MIVMTFPSTGSFRLRCFIFLSPQSLTRIPYPIPTSGCGWMRAGVLLFLITYLHKHQQAFHRRSGGKCWLEGVFPLHRALATVSRLGWFCILAWVGLRTNDDDPRANDRLMNISLSVEPESCILDLIIIGIPKSAYIHPINLYYRPWTVLCKQKYI